MPKAYIQYSEDIADEICERLGNGESLKSICKDEHMPRLASVFRWLGSHTDFRDRYMRARKTQADALVDEIVDIADDSRNDWMERNDKDNAGWVANGDAINRARLRVDTRKWFASKVRPKVYGDRLMQEHSGPDGGPIDISVVHRVMICGPQDDLT